MKKLFHSICLATLMLCAIPLSAQWELGLQAGVGAGRINADLYPVTSRGEFQVVDQKFSWLFGMTAKHQLSGPISFSAALHWSFIAGHDEYWIEGVKSSATDRSVHYINLPLMVRLDVSRFNCAVGYQLGTPIVERGIFNSYPLWNGFGEYVTNETKDLGLRRTDFGAVAELGFRITDAFTAGVRYYHGLQNIKDPSDGIVTPLRNQQCVLTIGYVICGRSKTKSTEVPVPESAPVE